MSETTTASPTGLGTGTSGSSLYGPSGERLTTGSGWRPNQGQSDQIGDFVMQQPMTAALVALVVGYFLGKLT